MGEDGALAELKDAWAVVWQLRQGCGSDLSEADIERAGAILEQAGDEAGTFVCIDAIAARHRAAGRAAEADAAHEAAREVARRLAAVWAVRAGQAGEPATVESPAVASVAATLPETGVATPLVKPDVQPREPELTSAGGSTSASATTSGGDTLIATHRDDEGLPVRATSPADRERALTEARLRIDRAGRYESTGDLTRTEEAYNDATRLFIIAGENSRAADALEALCRLLMQRGEVPQAIRLLTQVWALRKDG